MSQSRKGVHLVKGVDKILSTLKGSLDPSVPLVPWSGLIETLSGVSRAYFVHLYSFIPLPL